MSEYSDIHIESSLPKSWEHEETFNDVLYDWMMRAPWLAISAALHLVVFLIIQAIPWNLFIKKAEIVIEASVEAPPDEPFEEPPEEELEEVEEEELIEEPVIQDIEITEEVTDFTEDADPDMFSDSPFDENQFNNVLGIGGGAGGKFGGRMGRGKGKKGGGAGTEQSLQDALLWLKHHQSNDGSWDVDGFDINCGKVGAGVCDGKGDPNHDVGISGLAILAFLGDGHFLSIKGPYQENVSRGIKWLKQQQDSETGLIGEELGHHFLYSHGIAALAMSEAYYFKKTPLLKTPTQKAINYIHKARNPYSAWRYDVPPIGESDTSMSGWMVFALKSAEDSGLKVDREAFAGALNWFDEVTDPANGRVGYDQLGSLSSRVTGINDDFPAEKGEAMTSVGLLCRFFLGQTPDENPMMIQHADLMSQKNVLPQWDAEGKGCDMYYWYYGSYAMFQMGNKYGNHWKKWNAALKPTLLDNQRQDGDFKGSWDPAGPWGYSGGRVYSTAIGALCLEVYFRYASILGAR